MKKEEIQQEYDKLIPSIGSDVYKAMIPWLEILAKLQRAMYLNHEAYKITPKTGPKIAPEEPEQKVEE